MSGTMTIGLISVDGQPGQQKKYVQSLYLGGISEREREVVTLEQNPNAAVQKFQLR